MSLHKNGHQSANNGSKSLHGIAQTIEPLASVRNIKFGGLDRQGISDCVVVRHCVLGDEDAGCDEVFAKLQSEQHNTKHGDAA